MIGVTILAGVLLWDSRLGFYEGVLLFVLFTAFIVAMLRISRKEQQSGQQDPLLEEQESEIPEGVSNLKAVIWVVVGLVILPIAADTLVDSAVYIAHYFGMSDLVIGLTIIAVGTSLPELAASLAGVMKGEDDLAVGNIIGSNVFNILAVMGIPGVLNPSILSQYAMGRDFWIMLGVSLLLVAMALGKSRSINRIEGAILFCCFITYQGYLILNMTA